MTDIEILNLIRSILSVEAISKEDSPDTIHEWDSFSQIVILDELSRKTDVPVHPHELISFYTVDDLINKFTK